MGCCIGLKNDIFMGKEIIINLDSKDIEDYLGINRDFCRTPLKKKLRKLSTKTIETNDQSPIRSKKGKKGENFHEQITKEIARNLRLITKREVENIQKFFV